MTAPAPPPETPPEQAPAAKARRTRLQALAFFGGLGLAALAALVIVLAFGGRTYLVSDAGRELITGFVAGQKVGRYGRINVEGLRGDLFDDFTLARVTVTDAQGVWLEAENVRVDWRFWPLVARRFDAQEITADRIRLIRRPEVEPPTAPPGPQPLSIRIARFAADIELMEDFAQDYGHWRLDGEADVPRQGAKTAKVNARSLDREGDHLRVDATFGGDIADLRLNLAAHEAEGGPLAGALGYSPRQPFQARAVVNGEIVDAVVRTGDFTPLTVQGRFGDEGARLSGYFDFSGSDLLAPFVERVGRTARFGFAMVPDARREGYRGVGWRLVSDNVNSHASGLIRMADRASPDGVRLEVSTRSLSRLAGSDLGGSAAYAGTFTGDAGAWRLRGAATVNDAHVASYRAARLSGPVNLEVEGGRMAVDLDVRGAGGSGSGVVGGLLGATPHIQAQAERQADGALLLRRIEARGQALTLTGAGSRGLDGALGFRGEAAITDLSRLQSGARGAFGGPIRAGQARTGAPWTLSFDGRGSRLATGLGELDRLLGAQPRLQLAGSLNGGRVVVDRGELTGAAGRAGAKGLIESDGRLRLALDWSAQGPFEAGPVEIGGTMRGQGGLTGTLAQPRADLTAAFDRIEAGALTLTQADLILSFRRGADASDGRIVVTSGSNYGPARAAGNFAFGGDRIRLSDVDLDAGGVTAQGSIALSDRIPSSADLTFAARPGAFLATGSAQGRVRLTDGAGPETAVLDVTARDARLAGSTWLVRNLQLQGRGALDRLPFTLALDVGGATPVQFNGTGVYAREGPAHSLTLRGGGRLREVAFATRNPAVAAFSGDGRVVRLDLGVGGGVLVGELRQDSNAAVITANMTAVELGSIAPDLRGQVTGRVDLRGSGGALAGSANVDLRQLRSLDAPRGMAVDGSVNLLLAEDTLTVRAQARDAQSVQARADLVLPVEASAAPLRLAVVRNRPLSGDVSIQGQIQPIWDLFLGGERSLAGQVNAQADIGGTLIEPRLNGRLDLAEGSFRDVGTGLRLENVVLANRFDDTTAVIERFEAADGARGSASGDGRLGLRQGSPSTLRLQLDRFRIIDNDIADARASGPITVTRAADGNIQLAGRLEVVEAEIAANPPGSNGVVRMDVVEINRPGGDPAPVEPRQGGPQIGLNLDLTGRQVFVRGRGLDVELGVRARVAGSIRRPVLTGTAEVVRGDYEFAGKRFVFDNSGTIALSTDPSRIRLNLSAVREDPALTATIRVTGTAAAPEIALTSTPELPQDEILSQVLFGRSASQLSAFEAAQLASGVASLAGGGGFDVIGNIRELAGLDRLSFGGDASALTVAGGRYITDNVYLEIIGGGEGGAAFNVEWQVRRNLAVASKFGGQGDAVLSIRWKRESRRPGERDGRRRP